jgi:hypothetical protein
MVSSRVRLYSGRLVHEEATAAIDDDENIGNNGWIVLHVGAAVIACDLQIDS